MSLAALYALAKRIPGMAWVFALVLALLAAWSYAMYHNGVHAGARAVHQRTLADSVHVAESKKDTATAHSDTVVAVAQKARTVSEATRSERVTVRQAALAELLDRGLPKIHALVALDDSLSARDSVTIAVQAGAIDTLLAERATRERLDALRVNTIALGTAAPESHHLRDAATGAAVLAILYGIVKAVTR